MRQSHDPREGRDYPLQARRISSAATQNTHTFVDFWKLCYRDSKVAESFRTCGASCREFGADSRWHFRSVPLVWVQVKMHMCTCRPVAESTDRPGTKMDRSNERKRSTNNGVDETRQARVLQFGRTRTTAEVSQDLSSAVCAARSHRNPQPASRNLVRFGWPNLP